MKRKPIQNMTRQYDSHLEPRVVKLEAGLDILTKNVTDLTTAVRENAFNLDNKMERLTVAVTEAAAPKKTDWSMIISAVFLILALGSAVFWPLNQTAQLNSNDLKAQQQDFKDHTTLTLHPVGQALLQRVEEQLKIHVDNNNREMAEHKAYDINAHSELDKKLQLEYNLITKATEIQLADLEKRQSMFNDKIYNRVVELERARESFRDKEIDELRQWRNKADGLSSPEHMVPLIDKQVSK